MRSVRYLLPTLGNTHTHICTRTLVHTQMHRHIHMHAHTRPLTCTQAHSCTHEHTRTHTHTYLFFSENVFAPLPATTSHFLSCLPRSLRCSEGSTHAWSPRSEPMGGGDLWKTYAPQDLPCLGEHQCRKLTSAPSSQCFFRKEEQLILVDS